APELVGLVELLLPVGAVPLVGVGWERCREVADEVRPDLVALVVRAFDLRERPARVLARRREADVGATRRMTRRVVLARMRPVDEVDAADEEGEVRMDPPRDRAPVRPELRPARAVERDDDVLRAPLWSWLGSVDPRLREWTLGRRRLGPKPCERQRAGN